jgi:predicted MFS family arabinose efflux permease
VFDGERHTYVLELIIGLLGVFMAMRFINESRSEVKTVHFDWWGALILGGALSSLVLVLDKGVEWGWLSFNSILCYALVFVSLYIFVKIEQKAKEPIIDLKFFKIPAFVNALLNNFIVFLGMMGSLFLLPIFAQTFLGYNATETGYLFIPMAAALMLASPLGGSLTGKVESRYVIFASTLVASIGIFFFSFIDPKSTAFDLMFPLAIMAFGLGFGMAQRTNANLNLCHRQNSPGDSYGV